MSKAKARPSAPSAVREMRAEYRFDYTQSQPNRFAGQFDDDTVTVVLDPDVAKVFTTSDSVNVLLRSVIAAFPGRAPARSLSKKRKKAG